MVQILKGRRKASAELIVVERTFDLLVVVNYNNSMKSYQVITICYNDILIAEIVMEGIILHSREKLLNLTVIYHEGSWNNKNAIPQTTKNSQRKIFIEYGNGTDKETKLKSRRNSKKLEENNTKYDIGS